jgi:plasmid stabilization system protein ParE
LREIGLRIAKDNPQAAHGFFGAAKRVFHLLQQHPGLGRLRTFSQTGIRSFPIREFPKYLVFYLPVSDEVQILAVLHGMQDVERLVDERTSGRGLHEGPTESGQLDE